MAVLAVAVPVVGIVDVAIVAGDVVADVDVDVVVVGELVEKVASGGREVGMAGSAAVHPTASSS